MPTSLLRQNHPRKALAAGASHAPAPGNAAKGRSGGGEKRQAGMPAGAITLASHPIVYLNIPKSACTTIKNQLYFMEHGRYIDEPLDIHAHDGLLRSRHNTDEMNAVFKERLRNRHTVFTFVRHPGKRVYSCFSEKICYESKYSFPKVRDFIAANYGLALPSNETASYSVEQHRDNFVRFLAFVRDNFAGKTPIRMDAHWGRQSSIIQHFQRSFFIDLIGRVETFEKQFSNVLDQTPMLHRPDLRVRFNEGPKPPYRYEEVVDDSVAKLLHDLYTEDYELLGYADSADGEKTKP